MRYPGRTAYFPDFLHTGANQHTAISHKHDPVIFLDRRRCPILADAVDEDPLDQLLEHTMTYRIAVGTQAGSKVFAFQTLPACDLKFER